VLPDGAYLPIMSDEAMIVDKTGSIFLAGSYLVKAAIGENIDNETLGGSVTHSEISGVTDNRFPDDRAALDRIKNIFSKLGEFEKAGFNRVKPAAPKLNPKEIYGLIPVEASKQYDMHEVIYRLVDNSEFDEYKDKYGQSIICGHGAHRRLGRWHCRQPAQSGEE
jgi:acetyl-CoA carboxylase carboxyltransferase component